MFMIYNTIVTLTISSRYKNGLYITSPQAWAIRCWGRGRCHARIIYKGLTEHCAVGIGQGTGVSVDVDSVLLRRPAAVVV